MTTIRTTIEKLRELYKKAMPGEWTRMGKWIAQNPGIRLDVAVSDCFSDADAMFIAEAHNAMPELLDRIEELERFAAWIRDCVLITGKAAVEGICPPTPQNRPKSR